MAACQAHKHGRTSTKVGLHRASASGDTTSVCSLGDRLLLHDAWLHAKCTTAGASQQCARMQAHTGGCSQSMPPTSPSLWPGTDSLVRLPGSCLQPLPQAPSVAPSQLQLLFAGLFSTPSHPAAPALPSLVGTRRDSALVASAYVDLRPHLDALKALEG